MRTKRLCKSTIFETLTLHVAIDKMLTSLFIFSLTVMLQPSSRAMALRMTPGGKGEKVVMIR